MPEQFCTVNGDVELCYETFGDPGDPAVLLVMGLATQMVGWHEDFCEAFAERGYYVIRFDNRDIGRSQKMTGPGADAPAADAARQARGARTRSRTWRRTASGCSTTSGSSARTWSASRWAA